MATVTSGTDQRQGRLRPFRDQPRWFSTLFMVDMWERFSFYGMTAILYLYLVAPETDGGFGLDSGTATALFGTYMALMFIGALPGGWLADRVLGARRAVLYGGSLIALGHCAMAIPVRPFLYVGLLLVILGTGLAKPAMASLVSSPYRGRTEAREATMSVFYMSIQVSALLAPIVTGLLGERVDWHLGFGAAAVGMTIGLIQYVRGGRHFGDLGTQPERPIDAERGRVVARRAAYTVGIVALLAAVDVAAGTFQIEHVLALAGLLVVTLPVVAVTRLRRNPALGAADRSRLSAFVVLLLGSSVFWLLYAQGGSVLTRFAAEFTDRSVGGFVVPASWFQSAHPLFILAVAPVFAMLVLRWGSRADVPMKFAGALLLGGLSFVVMAVAAQLAVAAGVVSPAWLLGAYLLQVVGELALAPVGLSVAVQVAPDGFTNQYLGLFWLFAALGAGLGGQLARLSTVLPLPTYFLVFGAVAMGAGLLMALGARGLRQKLAVEG